ncbi:hypothetical protein [Rhodococcus koreensis]|uniref:hypothetical protein n=1 Tax=Rhodococcus koreensis TaxID=99653 RepID=UPI0036D99773
MVVEVSILVGYLIAWGMRKARRVGAGLDNEVDIALDAALDRLHAIVAEKLRNDSALTDLEAEAARPTGVGNLTKQRVELSLKAALQKDPMFATAVEEAVTKLAATSAGSITASGNGSVAISGNVSTYAEQGSAAAVTMGDVSIGGDRSSDPPQPGGQCR